MTSDAPRPDQRPRKIWAVSPISLDDLPALGLYFKKHLSAASQYGSMAIFHWRAVSNYVMPGIINIILGRLLGAGAAGQRCDLRPES